ncbi:hypothetical protein [Nocardiopsis composta]|uniref:Uncharacterized protein n=1 Tax=Nocardiopsis composta TaxID=157465 RepID=A0A7W8QT09_9ACTN|nr:hypothetical protein [Nocardiopsis composta]MBB5435629.1 hypothetical protein [Nocardiopsis composta]
MIHADLINALARERVADLLRDAHRSEPAVQEPAGDGPGGGRPRTGLESLLRHLGGAGAAESWMPAPRTPSEK